MMELAFGSWLRSRRRVLDLTQEDLAQKSSCSIVTIRKIESGDLIPSRDLARQLALALALAAAQHEAFIAFARSPHATAAATQFTDTSPGSQLAAAPSAARRFHLPAQMTATI